MLKCWIILIILVPNIVSQIRPGCPPSISKFTNFPTRVKVPKIAQIKVASLTFSENSYFGSSKCSLVQDLSKSEFYQYFSLDQKLVKDEGKNVKECSVYLLDENIQAENLQLNIILIVELSEGLRTFCESSSLISSTAKIDVDFCDPSSPGCLNTLKNWEIVGNVVRIKSSRSVDGGRQSRDENNILTNTLEVSSDEDVDVAPRSIVNLATSQDDLDVSNKIILGLALVTTLIAFSLILGLIYFWCPNLCCCMQQVGLDQDILDNTKILTVRDAEGRIIENATSVEVWKTRGNKIKTLDVLESVTKKNKTKSKRRRYSHLLSSDYKDRLEHKNDYLKDKDHHHHLPHGMRIINVGESLDGVIILRKSEQSSRNSQLTFVEELNPRKLYLKEIKPQHEDVSKPERRLSFSRHYSAKKSRSSSRGHQARHSSSADQYYQHTTNRRNVINEKPAPLSKQMKDNLVPFIDDNRTPTPAVNIAEHMLEEARLRRHIEHS